jgi:hypothetical protein
MLKHYCSCAFEMLAVSTVPGAEQGHLTQLRLSECFRCFAAAQPPPVLSPMASCSGATEYCRTYDSRDRSLWALLVELLPAVGKRDLRQTTPVLVVQGL